MKMEPPSPELAAFEDELWEQYVEKYFWRRLQTLQTVAAENEKLKADNERLRKLVKKAERGEADYCPFCDYYQDEPCECPDERRHTSDCAYFYRHAEDCPAFAPNGEVK